MVVAPAHLAIGEHHQEPAGDRHVLQRHRRLQRVAELVVEEERRQQREAGQQDRYQAGHESQRKQQAGDHLAWSDDNHASIDFNHDSHSAVIDGNHTRLLGPRLLNLLLWFDNEWGFANRMVDVTCHWQQLLSPAPGSPRP